MGTKRGSNNVRLLFQGLKAKHIRGKTWTFRQWRIEGESTVLQQWSIMDGSRPFYAVERSWKPHKQKSSRPCWCIINRTSYSKPYGPIVSGPFPDLRTALLIMEGLMK